MATVTRQLQVRQGTAAQWAAANTVLLAGEPGIATDTRVIFWGDGTKTYSALEKFPLSQADAITYKQSGPKTTRATGYGDVGSNGLLAGKPFLITSVRYVMDTADASGTTTVILTRNGTDITGTSGTAAVSPTTVTGLSVAVAATDVLAVRTSAIGTTPGKGLTAYITVVWGGA